MFVTIEGGEGGGKTTQALALAEALRGEGYEVLMTREPGGVPIAESVRAVLLSPDSTGMDPMTELLLYAACRAEHRAARIAPALQRGAIVVCDRYSDATIAYQGYGRALPLPAVREICRHAEGGCRPDLTFLLDLPPSVGLERARARGDLTRFEHAPLAFHERVREGYLRLAAEEPSRIVVVDATATSGEVLAAMRAELFRRLPRKP